MMKANGCNEDGWDLYEGQTRVEFEYYASRQGYDLFKHPEDTWTYFNQRTEEAWRMYHVGHVSGRTWSEEIL